MPSHMVFRQKLSGNLLQKKIRGHNIIWQAWNDWRETGISQETTIYFAVLRVFVLVLKFR